MDHIAARKILIRTKENSVNGVEDQTYAVLSSAVDMQYRMIIVDGSLQGVSGTIQAKDKEEYVKKVGEWIAYRGELIGIEAIDEAEPDDVWQRFLV